MLDGGLCAYRQGRISFTSLLRSHADRVRGGVPVSYIAFDLLAVPGRDVRAPPLQRVPVAEDEETARGWFRGLRRAGGEGIVAKRLDSAYRSGSTWSWRKGRHAEPVGLAGPALRPRALPVRLPDRRILPTTPRPTPARAREGTAAIAPRGDGGLAAATDPEHEPVPRIARPVAVELRQVPGRHRTPAFVRFGGRKCDSEGARGATPNM